MEWAGGLGVVGIRWGGGGCGGVGVCPSMLGSRLHLFSNLRHLSSPNSELEKVQHLLSWISGGYKNARKPCPRSCQKEVLMWYLILSPPSLPTIPEGSPKTSTATAGRSAGAGVAAGTELVVEGWGRHTLFIL